MKTLPIQRYRIAAAAGLLAAIGFSAQAQLAHYYQFSTGTANDQVGTANGTVEGTANISGGALNTDGSAGGWTGSAPANGVMLDPGAVSGITGSFTVSDWFLANFNGGYCSTFSFSDGTRANYILGTPARGNFPYASTISVVGGGGSYTGPGDTQASEQYQDNAQLHEMTVTYDAGSGILSYYIDGALGSYAGLPPTITDPGLNLSSLTDIGIAGGSPWPDNSIKGQTYSFAIFNQSLSASQVAAVYGLGDDSSASALNGAVAPVPEPSVLALGALGGLALLKIRQRAKR